MSSTTATSISSHIQIVLRVTLCSDTYKTCRASDIYTAAKENWAPATIPNIKARPSSILELAISDIAHLSIPTCLDIVEDLLECIKLL